jgi:hypothetical protein
MCETHKTSFEVFGVTMAVVSNLPDAARRIAALLPPSSKHSDSSPVATFGLNSEGAGTYEFGRDGEVLVRGLRLQYALAALQREMRAAIARAAPNHVFIHAGAVAHNGKAIIIPGTSFAGKTTLVSALVRAGAIYLSDEFAPIDHEGLVHPFPTALGLRDESPVQVEQDIRAIGGVISDTPFPLGAVILTNYRPGGSWAPRPISAGEASLALLGYTVAAQTRPAEALQAITRALRDALVMQSDRDEANAIAPALLRELAANSR